MLQRSEVEMLMMMVLMMKMMVMMIPMKSSSMVVTMAMISPSPGGISPADFCLPESFLLSGVFRPAAAVELFSESIFRVFQSWGVREVARPEVGQGGQTLPRRGPGSAPRLGQVW